MMNSRSFIGIFGLGISGQAAARWLLKEGRSVLGIDRQAGQLCTTEHIRSLLDLGLHLQDETVFPSTIEELILSPGISQEHPFVQEALRRHIPVIGEAEFALRRIRNPCIGITGTNGKTTTVLLTTHLLCHAGKKARAVGNVGVGLCSSLSSSDPEQIFVVELSSFQLESMQTRSLEQAVILNILPNHLDRHKTMEQYAQAKLNIARLLKEGKSLHVSRQVSEEYGAQLPPHRVFAVPSEAENGGLAALRSGIPEAQNREAAFAICREWGIGEDILQEGVKTFRKPAHRIEWVGERKGVSYFNDSKSSNVSSVLHAVSLFTSPLILIVGGTDKGASYCPWIEPFRNKVKMVIAYGAAGPKIESELSSHLPLLRFGPFQEAVKAAMQLAQKDDTVLLSPGGASYDQFDHFEHRGEVFKQIVRESI